MCREMFVSRDNNVFHPLVERKDGFSYSKKCSKICEKKFMIDTLKKLQASSVFERFHASFIFHLLRAQIDLNFGELQTVNSATAKFLRIR